ncbi:hypothetical protein [Vibrio sp. THAF190c]|uniref:hypothetical protein n=1 Tax=Vibrio sp. THAF190c TaxID=2587865 RepID=UPI001268925E|nr:hypothetical protein [Vibrio sp. THAF190c]QFT13491.1 hypothetical protein FIV04_26410 [Vibrio sp. THAF190c]
MKKLILALAVIAASNSVVAATSDNMTFSKTITSACTATVDTPTGALILDGTSSAPAESEQAKVTFSTTANTITYQLSSVSDTGSTTLPGGTTYKLYNDTNVEVSSSQVGVAKGATIGFFVRSDNIVTDAGDYQATAVLEVTCS